MEGGAHKRRGVKAVSAAFTLFFTNKKKGGIEPPLLASIHQNY
jgi:hypothetical protein